MSEFSSIASSVITIWNSVQSGESPITLSYKRFDDWSVENVQSDYAILVPVSYKKEKYGRCGYITEYAFSLKYVTINTSTDEVPSVFEDFENYLIAHSILPGNVMFKGIELTSPTRYSGGEGLAGIVDSGVLESEGIYITSSLLYFVTTGVV